MRHDPIARLSAVCLTMLIAVLALAGCAPPSETGSQRSDAPPPPGSSKAATLTAGVSDLGDGRTLARGWVAYVDLEGGFWALYDVLPDPESARQPHVVAVLLPGEVPEEQFEHLEGTFVGMEGTLSDGPSIRMAGPELVVDAVRAY